MIPLTLADVASLTGGALSPDAVPQTRVTTVVADSRNVTDGALFVAVPGAHVDGHDFAAAALAAGAVGVLACRPVAGPAVVVDDSVLALGRLAHGYLGRLSGPRVVGITGSSGKTTTKDTLAQVLATVAPTLAPQGSFNTEVGLPLTVLRADADVRFLVLEMSARGLDHIAYLCRVAPPEIGVVLNVGTAHLGEFGGRDIVARAKGELVAALPPTGRAVLNADDPLVAAMRTRTSAHVVTYGAAADADVRAVDVELDELARPRYRLSTAAGFADVKLQLPGVHQVSNTLAVAAVALEVGVALDAVAAALAAVQPVSRWRMQIGRRSDDVIVVNDAYNANPESMRAALAAVRAMTGRRRWAVLGHMAELGPASAAEHAELGDAVARSGIDRLVTVGDAAAGIADAAEAAGMAASAIERTDDARQARNVIAPRLEPGDVVLVKASRAAALDELAQALLDAAAPKPAAMESTA